MTQEKIKKLEALISKDYGNMAGLVVRKNNQLIYENYWNDGSSHERLHIFSATKSIVSLLIGIALDKGYLSSVDQKILEFFPDYVLKRGEKRLPEARLRDMLTMTVPYKYRGGGPYKKYFTSEDWVKSSLDLLGGRGEIGKFRYAPLIGPDILSGILVKVTGQPFLEFAKENLFEPLGIDVGSNIIFADKEEQIAFYKERNVYGWVEDPKGVNTAGWGLSLSAVDMAKIGQLCLNKGLWEGKRIVSESWLKESTSVHSRWEKMDLSYGYLWWVINPDEGAYAAMGDGGNVIYVNQQKDLVVAIASLFDPRAKDRIDLIQEEIEKIF